MKGAPDSLHAEIAERVAEKVLSLLCHIPRAEWRNNIIPFSAVYKKVGYVLKLDRRTAKRTLQLLAVRKEIEIVNSHGIVLCPNSRFPFSSLPTPVTPSASCPHPR